MTCEHNFFPEDLPFWRNDWHFPRTVLYNEYYESDLSNSCEIELLSKQAKHLWLFKHLKLFQGKMFPGTDGLKWKTRLWVMCLKQKYGHECACVINEKDMKNNSAFALLVVIKFSK